MWNFCCPICKQMLIKKDNSLICDKNHCFDKAKSGYVNLLLSNKMNSKTPGDNKLMVNTRNKFLSKGYYSILKDKLCNQVVNIAKNMNQNSIHLLDAGCGEGYYTKAMSKSFIDNNISFDMLGIDISKFALNIAAKSTKDVQFSVASTFDLPVNDNSCDIVTELFAPYCGEEFYRVLKKDGFLILVIPSTQHLYELKEAIYENPYENEVKGYEIKNFNLIKKTEVFSEIELDNNEDIENLFMMTPYYYKTSKENAKRLEKLSSLKTKIQFEILCYQVIKD